MNTSIYNFYKIVFVFLIYIGVYLYSLIQTIDLCYQLHKFRTALYKKIKELCTIQNRLRNTYTKLSFDFWKPFEPSITKEDLFDPIDTNLEKLYTIFFKSNFQEKVFKLYKVCIIHDCLLRIHLLKDYKLITYGSETYIGNMKNPILSETQIANPLNLQKNIIISGPNAGGKTTYVKSLLWNILLSQTLGLFYGDYGMIKPYDAILHHHRVTDVVGDSSLFQAEMKKVKEMFYSIEHYKNIIYFLDEPFHSTHPLDGAAMLKSLLYYFSTKHNIKTVVTSHYFSIQDIEQEIKDKFINLSVKAIITDTDIIFDYKLYKGGSTQTIGIELLRKDNFPSVILLTATKMKKKLYRYLVNV